MDEVGAAPRTDLMDQPENATRISSRGHLEVTHPTGRLKRIDLRTCWEREDSGFTTWLAQAENVRLLGETIGLKLEVEAQEQAVGSFAADLVCRDSDTDDLVLIENQIEPTDHRHLGQLLTYAAGLRAAALVWIARSFRDEHRAAIDWLNEVTGHQVSFFGLEIELWQIGESPIAPKFNVVAKPNDWSRSVSSVASAMTDTRRLQLEYWTAFSQFLRECGSSIKPVEPRPKSWLRILLGRSGLHLAAVASTWNSELESYERGEIRAEVVLRHPAAKWYFQLLERERSVIEAEAGEPLVWWNPESSRQCSIYLRRDADLGQREAWREQHQWLRQKLEVLHRVFAHRIRALPAPERPQSEAPHPPT